MFKINTCQSVRSKRTVIYGSFLLVLFNLIAASQIVDVDSSIWKADILKDVANYYHAGCVVIAGSDADFSLAGQTVEIGKNLETKFVIATRIRDLHEFMASFKCQQNRPLYVLFDSVQTWNFLASINQVPSYPRWILFLGGDSTINDSLRQANIPFDCEFLTVKWMGDFADLNLVFKVHEAGLLNTEPFATWLPKVGLRVKSQESLYERRHNLQGVILKALASSAFPPAVIVNYPNENESHAIVSGFIGDTWNLLSDKMNFRTETIASNATIGSMIRQVASQRADCVLADVTMGGTRLDSCRFLMTMITSKLRLTIRKPEEVSVEWDILIAPFDRRLWVFFLFSLLVTGLCLSFVQSKTKRYRQNVEEVYSFGDSFISVVGVFFHQGCDMSYRPRSAITLLMTISLTSMVIVAAYSGALVSFLAHQKLLVPFESLQGLEDDGTYKLGTLQGQATLEMFENATSPLYRRMYDKYFHHDGSNLPLFSVKELHLICSEQIAFLATREYEEKYEKIINHSCQMSWLDEVIRPLSTSIVVAKTSPYRGALDHWLHRMRDAGIMNYFRLAAWPSRQGLEETPPEFTSLTFMHVAPILSMLTVGLVFSVVILFAELAVDKWHHSFCNSKVAAEIM